MAGIELPKALDAIPVVVNSTDRDARYPTPSTNQRVFRLDTSNVELYTGSSWSVVIVGQNVTEGSWTPAFVGATIPGTFTYSSQVGRYIKVGNLVTAWCYLVVTSTTTSATGNLTIAGLPYASSNVTGLNQACAIGSVNNITLGAGYTEFAAYIIPNSTAITLAKTGSGVGAPLLAGSDLGSAPTMMLSVTYRVG